jgi:hypothetical protein
LVKVPKALASNSSARTKIEKPKTFEESKFLASGEIPQNDPDSIGPSNNLCETNSLSHMNSTKIKIKETRILVPKDIALEKWEGDTTINRSSLSRVFLNAINTIMIRNRGAKRLHKLQEYLNGQKANENSKNTVFKSIFSDLEAPTVKLTTERIDAFSSDLYHIKMPNYEDYLPELPITLKPMDYTTEHGNKLPRPKPTLSFAIKTKKPDWMIDCIEDIEDTHKEDQEFDIDFPQLRSSIYVVDS